MLEILGVGIASRILHIIERVNMYKSYINID